MKSQLTQRDARRLREMLTAYETMRNAVEFKQLNYIESKTIATVSRISPNPFATRAELHDELSRNFKNASTRMRKNANRTIKQIRALITKLTI